MSRDGETRTSESQAADHATVPEHLSGGGPTFAGAARRYARVSWAVLSSFVVESLIFGLAALPAVSFWEWHRGFRLPSSWLSVVFLSMAFVPAYLLFSASLIVLSALAMRLLGWRTPRHAAMRIADLEWPLLNWARYAISMHLVRTFAGSLFHATPLWILYLRLNGARVGRGVYLNSLALVDHNLLEFGDATVIGSGVFLSGHTVESGVVKTAPVRLGRNVTIGVGSVIGIGVDIGDGAQVGALSLVPKGAQLEAGKTYVGIPVRSVASPEAA